MDLMVIIWVAAAALFLITEAMTVGLTSIWLAVGALGALVVALCKGQLWLQIAVFIVVTIAALIVTRPLAKKYINAKKSPTNADRLFGVTGLVTEEIDNIKNVGTVTISGQVWTARSMTGETLAAGTKVKPVSIEGVKLIVVKDMKTEE